MRRRIVYSLILLFTISAAFLLYQRSEQPTILDGHDGSVIQGIAWSPDGNRLVSGAWDGQVIIWEVDQRQAVFEMQGHLSEITSVAYSRDGTWVASGDSSGQIFAWDALSGELVFTTEHHEQHIVDIHFLSNGRQAISGAHDGKAVMWDVVTGDSIKELALDDPIYSIAAHPDDEHVAIGTASGDVYLWLPATDQLTRIFTHPDGYVHQVNWSPDGHYLAASADGNSITIWNTSSGYQHRELIGHVDWVFGLDWSPLAPLKLASGSRNGVVLTWDVESPRRLATFEGHQGIVHTIAYHPDGSRLASAGNDGLIRIWEVE